MSQQYKTPGVYVEEKSTISPSVAGVDTAIPAFIGFTQNGPKNTPVAISSLLEYQNIFGKGPTLTVDAVTKKVSGQEFAMYDSMRLFFDNGGADCFVISLGDYSKKPDSAEYYKNAIDKLEEADEVTIVLFPDAAPLLPISALAEIQCYALNKCEYLKNRFAILDLKEDGDLTHTMDVFRSSVSVAASALSYGAAYYPYFKTSYKKDIAFSEVIKAVPAIEDSELKSYVDKIIKLCDESTKAELLSKDKLAAAEKEEEEAEEAKKQAEETFAAAEGEAAVAEAKAALNAAESTLKEKAAAVAELKEYAEIAGELELRISAVIPQIPGYAKILEDFQDDASVITPSGAMAGLYAATDRRAGVWQAPANVGVSSVKALTLNITDAQQEKMNVDAKAGKSINAIRFFKGKGNIVWGSRTLNSNDGEWKYIPVRRLFSYVEQSLKLATAWAVFQPNDANTWTKIKCQIEGFLTTLWRDGALAGATPDKAFMVEVGLGITMSSDDIRDGNLRVRIGMAAVRPAEFIILEFSHKVQE